jgi:cytochrome c553
VYEDAGILPHDKKLSAGVSMPSFQSVLPILEAGGDTKLINRLRPLFDLELFPKSADGIDQLLVRSSVVRFTKLPDEDIKDVSAYLASIELPTKWPVFKDNDDALTRLTAMEKVMIVPRAEGNVDNGGAIYQKQCASCHGKTGKGRGKFPLLIGQYTNYLRKQMDSYVKGERPHDEDDSRGILATLKESDMQDILAYLTTLQDSQQ